MVYKEKSRGTKSFRVAIPFYHDWSGGNVKEPLSFLSRLPSEVMGK